MKLFLATFVIFTLSMLAMAVGVLSGRSCIAGSCGGVADKWGDSERPRCDFCPRSKARDLHAESEARTEEAQR